MTAPLAIIRVNGNPAGKIKTIRCTESLRLGRVVGLGRLNPSELPPLDWSGTANISAYLIDLKKAVIPGTMQRICQTTEQWQDTLTLGDDNVQIDLLRKVKGTVNALGIVIPALEVLASIRGTICSRESIDVSEGQISGRDVDFEYTDPILFPI
jgi:hypothetical protein